jgi:hypothetical protein
MGKVRWHKRVGELKSPRFNVRHNIVKSKYRTWDVACLYDEIRRQKMSLACGNDDPKASSASALDDTVSACRLESLLTLKVIIVGKACLLPENEMQSRKFWGSLSDV